MLTLEIYTSRSGKVWPTQYWKVLIDSLARGGSKHDPRLRYPDLAGSVGELIEERAGRFVPRDGTSLSVFDDSAIRMIMVRKASGGSERIGIGRSVFPDSSTWPTVRVSTLRTIGSARAEAQSNRNRAAISKMLEANFDHSVLGAEYLALAFRLKRKRSGRIPDADNLTDALIPLFNARMPRTHQMCVFKLDSTDESEEEVRLCINTKPMEVIFSAASSRSANTLE